MRPVIARSLDADRYVAEVCLVWCFDDRFTPLLEALVERESWSHVDLVKVAGGAKGLASPENESERDYLLDQVAKSIRLHAPRVIGLMVHADCGAYGGPEFGTAEEESAFYRDELAKAEAAVTPLAKRAGIPIRGFFAHFAGLHER